MIGDLSAKEDPDYDAFTKNTYRLKTYETTTLLFMLYSSICKLFFSSAKDNCQLLWF